MSTWHQQQNMPVLWHPTLWTVVFDPPDQTLSVERFKDPRREELSDKDQLALAKVTARITGNDPMQYTLGLFDVKGDELRCLGYARAPIGSTFVGNHSATFGPFPVDVTVAGAVIYAPMTGDPISKVSIVTHKIRSGETLNFNYTVQP